MVMPAAHLVMMVSAPHHSAMVPVVTVTIHVTAAVVTVPIHVLAAIHVVIVHC